MPRKEKKFHFIYKTTNLLNDKYYIGMHSTDDLKDGYLGSGKRLRYSINKHGIENHEREILEFVDNRDELKKREEEVVNLDESAKKKCMNLKVGGEGGFISVEQQRRRSIAGSKASIEKLRTDKDFRERQKKTVSENFKKAHKEGKIKYDTFTGKKHTEETKKLIGESMKGLGKGEENSQYGTCWITRDGKK